MAPGCLRDQAQTCRDMLAGLIRVRQVRDAAGLNEAR